MNIQRQLRLAALVGLGSGLVGCQSPMGGLAFWKSDRDAAIASASPDVGRQKYEGLAQEFGGKSKAPTSGLGSGQPAESGNFVSNSWNKTTAAVASVFSKKTPIGEADDPTHLGTKSKKMGAEVYVAAARLMENQGKLPEAQEQYEKALKATPNSLNAMVGLARLQDRQGQGSKAIEIYQRAAKAHPQSALVQNDLGLCLARQKQWQPSLAALNKAIELAPADAKYRNNLAMVLVDMGRPDEALPHLASVSNAAVAHYNLGYLLQQKGQRDLAIRHLQQAAALDANLAPAREMLAQLGSPAPAFGPAAGPESRMAIRPVSTPISTPIANPFSPPMIEMPPAQAAPPQAMPLPALPTGSAQGASYEVGDEETSTSSQPRTLSPSSYYEGISEEDDAQALPAVEN
ncbi:MAG: tetratricopeptide repeat protein [Pirellulaceae bacterium]|nr:tetratricopeptide repeat protein [Pirellulaceae bacterium]